MCEPSRRLANYKRRPLKLQALFCPAGPKSALPDSRRCKVKFGRRLKRRHSGAGRRIIPARQSSSDYSAGAKRASSHVLLTTLRKTIVATVCQGGFRTHYCTKFFYDYHRVTMSHSSSLALSPSPGIARLLGNEAFMSKLFLKLAFGGAVALTAIDS